MLQTLSARIICRQKDKSLISPVNSLALLFWRRDKVSHLVLVVLVAILKQTQIQVILIKSLHKS